MGQGRRGRKRAGCIIERDWISDQDDTRARLDEVCGVRGGGDSLWDPAICEVALNWDALATMVNSGEVARTSVLLVTEVNTI